MVTGCLPLVPPASISFAILDDRKRKSYMDTLQNLFRVTSKLPVERFQHGARLKIVGVGVKDEERTQSRSLTGLFPTVIEESDVWDVDVWRRM
jgi:hypothetical protein